jgi:hypothetical protein
VDELSVRADGVAVARARLRPDALAPFDAVAQLLATAGAEQDGLEQRLHAAGVAPARAGALVGEALAVLQPTGDQATEADRESRFAAWVEVLDALAGERVGLWIVEDVHWAGLDVLAFLAYAGLGPGRRLVVGTGRPALLESAANWCADVPLFHLEPLPAADASELVRGS